MMKLLYLFQLLRCGLLGFVDRFLRKPSDAICPRYSVSAKPENGNYYIYSKFYAAAFSALSIVFCESRAIQSALGIPFLRSRKMEIKCIQVLRCGFLGFVDRFLRKPSDAICPRYSVSAKPEIVNYKCIQVLTLQPSRLRRSFSAKAERCNLPKVFRFCEAGKLIKQSFVFG